MRGDLGRQNEFFNSFLDSSRSLYHEGFSADHPRISRSFYWPSGYFCPGLLVATLSALVSRERGEPLRSKSHQAQNSISGSVWPHPILEGTLSRHHALSNLMGCYFTFSWEDC